MFFGFFMFCVWECNLFHLRPKYSIFHQSLYPFLPHSFSEGSYVYFSSFSKDSNLVFLLCYLLSFISASEGFDYNCFFFHPLFPFRLRLFFRNHFIVKGHYFWSSTCNFLPLRNIYLFLLISNLY